MLVQQFKVEGMTCNHCRMTVETNLMKLPGLTSVQADVITGNVTVEGESIRPDKIKETINALGYRFVN
jgi:copper chaperone CopZ